MRISRIYTQEYSSIKSNGIAIVPMLLLVAGVFIIALSNDSAWLPTIVAAAFLTCIVIASLLLAPPGLYTRVAGTGAIALLTSAIFLVEVLSLHRNLDWIATSQPALFLLLSGITLTMSQWQTPQRHLIAWSAIALYIGMIYLADLSGYWWFPAVVSSMTFLPFALSLRVFSRERSSRQSTLLKTTSQLTSLAILASLVLGFITLMSQHGIWQGRYSTGTAWVLGLTAMICVTRQILRTRLVLWSIATYPAALLLLVSIVLAHGSWWEMLLATLLLPMLSGAHVLAKKLPQPRRRLLDRI